ncbi:GDSL esterase/lipase At4g16230-like [Durio zibethinus]|uniref:GDSL esterase/lipase At4g16230-like n=1 Tax=Durio zibethinus TaxID=66656 RepID=A0A6P5XA68_DURZI|nr:GDSL esterase/lipase At4g16230-like [Durio zibethinus]
MFLVHMATNLKNLFIIFVMHQILAIHYCPGICCSAQNVSAVFIFGDSLVDVGNNYYVNTLAMPTFPNGIDFVHGAPSGRYTNARTVTDIIEEELGFKNFTPPYLNPNTTGDVVLKGVNYASSGSGILNSTGAVFGAPICMDEQINNFAKTRQYIISRIGDPAAKGLFTQALYFVAIGANDIFSGEAFTSANDSYLDHLMSKFKAQLTGLYDLDARKIIVTNAPMVGCTPFERDLHSSGDGCVDFLNELAKLYNIRLKSLLRELTTNLSGSTFVYLDTYAMSENILQNYRSYGFENAEIACCQAVGQHGGLVPCGSFSRVCPDRTKYVFWDPFHPTDSVNLIMAKFVLDGDLNYVSPMNIRQLVNS